MRKIEEWISMILEFVFKIDKNSSPEKLLKLEESKEVLKDFTYSNKIISITAPNKYIIIDKFSFFIFYHLKPINKALCV